MKRVLVTGQDGYIATALCKHLEKGDYSSQCISVIGDEWKKLDFSEYDVIVHTAGIVHRKNGEVSRDVYFRVNAQLTAELAKKASEDGVKSFIFLSSMSVYGIVSGKITAQTPEKPDTPYGESKLEAEKLLKTLSDNIGICIMRMPMVYGRGCGGNYPKLASFAGKLSFFPNYKNERSMIYIENLCECIRLYIDALPDDCTLICPQNSDYVRTGELVADIAAAHGKKLKLTKLFNPFISLFLKLHIVKSVEKVFGSLTYEKDMSVCPYGEYDIVKFGESVKRTEIGV